MTPYLILHGRKFLNRALIAAALFHCSGAQAQLFRAYLASYGSDANPCTLVAPCRLLPAALTAVASNGEIWMLDSANFNTGTVNVSKSVTLLAIPGEVGSVVAQASSPAISITTPGVSVSLRNLAIQNYANNPGSDGISVSASSVNLSVERCLIANTPGNGISVLDASSVSVSDSVVRNTEDGIYARAGAMVDVSRVAFSGIRTIAVHADGSVAGTTSQITVSDSNFATNNTGAYAFSSSNTATARITVTRSSFSTGGYGVASGVSIPGAVASVSVSNSLLASLAVAFFQNGTGAVTESFGNNTVRNNTSNVSGTLTTVSAM